MKKTTLLVIIQTSNGIETECSAQVEIDSEDDESLAKLRRLIESCVQMGFVLLDAKD